MSHATNSSKRWPLLMLALNAFGASAYVLLASNAWVIPQECEAGIRTITGEPIVWFISIAPVVAAFRSECVRCQRLCALSLKCLGHPSGMRGGNSHYNWRTNCLVYLNCAGGRCLLLAQSRIDRKSTRLNSSHL